MAEHKAVKLRVWWWVGDQEHGMDGRMECNDDMNGDRTLPGDDGQRGRLQQVVINMLV